MSDENTMLVQPLSLSTTMMAVPAFQVATAMSLSVLQQAVVAVSGGGPEFAAANEPLQDGIAYAATDGVSYYRPLLRVGSRGPGLRPGPDVWFLQDDNGDITFQWSLEAVPLVGGPAGARPLPITVTRVRLVADPSYVLEFAAPGVDPIEGAADGAPAFRIHGGVPNMSNTDAATLESMLNVATWVARMEVTYTYAYTVQVAVAEPDDPGPRPRRPWLDQVAVRDHRERFQPQFMPNLRLQQFAAPLIASGDAAVVEVPAVEVAPALAFKADFAALSVDAGTFAMSRRVSPVLRDVIAQQDLRLVIGQHTRPESRTQTVVRTVPFVFEPSKEENGPIYRALHDTANLTGTWTLVGDAGWLRDSELPNTVFRLPDAVRLAWDPETGAPRLLPTLHRNANGDPRVRLLLALAPWQDPAKLVLTRSGTHLPAARIVVGGADSSTLQMGGAFPEELTVIGGSGGIPFGIATGAELVLDVSHTFYDFFCRMLVRPDGVNGQVQVVVGSEPAVGDQPAHPRTVQIPVNLRLDRVNDLPCAISVPRDVAAPQTVTVSNLSGAEISVGGATGAFLQKDEDSIVPVDAYPARCTSTFPIVIPAAGTAELHFELETPAPDLLWNSVMVELLDKKLTTTPDTILRRVHELAPPGDADRTLTVTCPVFQIDTLPAQWSSLVSIEVELTVGTSRPISVVLSKANPVRQVDIPTTLQDLVQGTVGGITTVKYRVRNNYADHQGLGWTQPAEQSGTDLVAYPHPAAGD